MEEADEILQDNIPMIDEDEEDENLNRDGDSTSEDFYALLNISRTATEDEIKASYRRLSLVYHPDRQRSEADASVAHEKFSAIKLAYDTLMDPKKRELYDELGPSAIKNSDITIRDATVDEVRKELERIWRQEKFRKLIADAGQRGSTIVELVPSWGPNGVPEVSAKGIKAQQSMQFQLSNSSLLSVGGHMDFKKPHSRFAMRRQTAFSGHLFALFQHSFSPLTLMRARVKLNPNYSPIFSYSVHHFLDTNQTHIKIYGDASFDNPAELWDPSKMKVTLSRPFFSSYIGTMTLDSQSLFIKMDAGNVAIGAVLKPNGRSVATLGYSNELTDKTTASLNLNASFFGAYLRLGLTHKLSWRYKIGAALVMDPTELVLELNITRISQTLSLPITLTYEPSLSLATASLITFVISFGFLKKYIIDPLSNREKQKNVEDKRKQKAELLATRKREAEAAVRSMSVTVERKRATEEAKRGLLIVEAKYGKLNADGTPEDPDDLQSVIDVTIPLQFQVEDSKIRLPQGSKSNLVGFYDPCFGEPKRLAVIYLFKDRMHKVVANDLDAFDAPLQSHLLKN